MTQSNNSAGSDQRSSNGDPSLDKEFTVDSVHRYNKKIESLNYEYNHMLAQTVRTSSPILSLFSQRTKEPTSRDVFKSSTWKRTTSSK